MDNIEKPLVSIIIPVFNAAKTLKRCFDSIVSQVYSNFEVIFVDDCSTDESLLICKSFCDSDKRFFVVKNSYKRGTGGSRNAGVLLAKGDFIAFLDSDDSYMPYMLEHMINAIVFDKTDCAICGVKAIDENGVASDDLPSLNPGIYDHRKIVSETMLDHLPSYAGTKLLKKELLVGNKFPELVTFEDIPTTYLFLDKARNISVLDEALYCYYFNRQSISHSFAAINPFFLFMFLRDRYFFSLKHYPDISNQCLLFALRFGVRSSLLCFGSNNGWMKNEGRVERRFIKENFHLARESVKSATNHVLLFFLCYLPFLFWLCAIFYRLFFINKKDRTRLSIFLKSKNY